MATTTWAGRSTRSPMAKPDAGDVDDGAVGHVVCLAHGDGLVPRGVEGVADGTDALGAVARQERLHLVEDAPQPLGERAVVGRLQRPLDVVERLEELAQQGLPTLGHPALDLAAGSLAVVVEVCQGSLQAVVCGRELLGELVGRLRRLLVALAGLARRRQRGLGGSVHRRRAAFVTRA